MSEAKNIGNEVCAICNSDASICYELLNNPGHGLVQKKFGKNTYKKKEVLFGEGTRPLGVYCIQSGKIKVYKIGFDGKQQIVQIARAGDILGYRALISEELYPVSAETLEETDACFIPQEQFFEYMERSNTFTKELLKQACTELGMFTEKLTHQAQMTVRERFAIVLYQLCDIYRDCKSGGHVEINLTREDLANLVGTATETLIRLVHDFKEEGLIDSKGRKIRILKPENLTKIGHITAG